MGGMAGAPSIWDHLPLLAVLVGGGAYACGVLRLARRGDHWPVSSRLWFALALVSVLIGTGYPPPAQHSGFAQRAFAHLILLMLAPMALALSAPVTLWLRASRPRMRRKTLRLLHSRPARLLTRAPIVVLLDVTGLYAYYLTPVFGAAEHHAPLPLLLHVHMFASGVLLSWFVFGRDPGPRPGGLGVRLTVLLVTAAAHDVMAKLMYAHLLPAGAGTARQIEAGAQILYYGGDAIELLSAAVVMTVWYRQGGRELRRRERRNTRLHAAVPSGN